MSDDGKMVTKHLDDCLDYLYGELPPERLAEAKRHLAECPAYRAEVKNIWKTITLYRDAPKPAPPPELTKRTASLVMVRTEAANSSHIDDDSRAGLIKPRKKLLGEIPPNRRNWFYHPAWTVAASVIFICSLLIHFSSRHNGRRNGPPIPLPTNFPAQAAPTEE
ncbi:MAG: zf-HC2 domain-containing protein, partial [Planctomycetes bacterium]|nr:zf-HC2 domain-containing protein [Planctomycetota bacterium]